MIPARITPKHLRRAAYVYIRQSSPTQVQENLESRRRQYELADRARTLGWRRVEVVDEDLGRSGSGRVARPGFQRLVSAVCLEEVGAVFALEASRLARNNRDWHHLVDLCGLTSTLIIDAEGVYDPHHFNDRLLLGLKGTMSEWELGVMRQRSLVALREKAERGELHTMLPIGFLRTRDDRCELDRDRLSAQHPHQSGICGRLRVRADPHGDRDRGRPAEKTPRDPGRAGRVGCPDSRASRGLHRVGAVSGEPEADRGERAYEGSMRRGAPRKGRSLLAGLLRCRRCGRRLHVTYSGAKGRVVRYSCRGAAIHHGAATCISFGGLAADRAVEEAVLAVIQPGALEAAIRAAEHAKEDRKRDHEVVALKLEQARYEAERTRRQYDAAEPENRLVAAELERRWNRALEAVAEVEREWVAFEAGDRRKDERIDREALLELAEDLPGVWHDPESDMRLKKRIVGTLIEEILVDVDEESARIRMVRWAGGQHAQLSVRKQRKGQHRYTTDRKVVDIVRELAAMVPDGQIARRRGGARGICPVRVGP